MERKTTLPSSFNELISSSDVPVLVDFYAQWCGPCKVVSPVVARIARANKGRLLTIKIDIDRKPEIARQYQVSAVPTIMLFKGGTAVVNAPGARPFDELSRLIAPHL